MSSSRRQNLQVFLLLVLLSSAALWCYGRMSESREAARQAAADTQLCQALAGRIELLQRRPSLAGSQELALAELAKRIEQAAAAAQVPAASLVRISPEAARRLSDNSPYKEKPTQVLLRNVTLGQVLRFLHELTTTTSDEPDGGSTGLLARQIRLSAPRESDEQQQQQKANDRWVLEAMLSYLIYSPASPSTPGTGSSSAVAQQGALR